MVTVFNMPLENKLKILEESVQSHLNAIGQIGRDPIGGWTRLAFSPEEQEAHDYAKKIFEQGGYIIRIDAFGNLIASKEGKNPNKKRVMLGTHLDTVSNGGNYDGVVGFITAVEAVKLAEAEKGQLDYGIDVVIFRAEESTRFKRACLGSSAAFGFLSHADIQNLVYGDEPNLTSLEQAIKENRGDTSKIGTRLIDPLQYFAYLETHIEQADVLTKKGMDIGIVTSIRAPERRKITVRGKNCIRAVAEMVLSVENIATKYAKEEKDIAGTVGKVNGYFDGQLNNINTIPGNVQFQLSKWDDNLREKYNLIAEQRGVKYCMTEENNEYIIGVNGTTDHSGGTPMGFKFRKDALAAACEMILKTDDYALPPQEEITFYTDLRSNDVTTRNLIQREVGSAFDAYATKYNVKVNAFVTEQSEPVKSLDIDLQRRLEESAKQLDLSYMYLPSGAGHDAMKAAQAGIPTVMLFVPSRNGSHNPTEFAENRNIAYAIMVGANFLTNLK